MPGPSASTSSRGSSGAGTTRRALGSLLLECARYHSLATATRSLIKKAHRGRLFDRNVSGDRFHRLPHPHLKRTPSPDELKRTSPTSTKRLKTTSASLKGTQWPFTSTKCHALKPSSDDQDALDAVDRDGVRSVGVYLPSFKRSEECRELLDFCEARSARP